MIGTYNSWVYCVGLGARSVVNFSWGRFCVWRSQLHYLGYTLKWSLVFGARLCWGGGGGNVTFHDIQVSAGMFYY